MANHGPPATADRSTARQADGRQRGHGWALLATSLGYGVVQLDVNVVNVVNVAIKPIGAELGGSIGGLQWIVTGYATPAQRRTPPCLALHWAPRGSQSRPQAQSDPTSTLVEAA